MGIHLRHLLNITPSNIGERIHPVVYLDKSAGVCYYFDKTSFSWQESSDHKKDHFGYVVYTQDEINGNVQDHVILRTGYDIDSGSIPENDIDTEWKKLGYTFTDVELGSNQIDKDSCGVSTDFNDEAGLVQTCSVISTHADLNYNNLWVFPFVKINNLKIRSKTLFNDSFQSGFKVHIENHPGVLSGAVIEKTTSELTIKINRGVTTEQQIKNAFLARQDLRDQFVVSLLASDLAQLSSDNEMKSPMDPVDFPNYNGYDELSDARKANPPFSVFYYTAKDEGDRESNPLPVYVYVTPVNDSPIFNTEGGEVTVDEDECTEEDSLEPCNFKIPAGNDPDLDENLSYVIVNLPYNGDLASCAGLNNSDGVSDISCSYFPNPNFSGEDFSIYKVVDQDG